MNVNIAKSDAPTITRMANAAANGSYSVVLPPVDFTVTATFNGKTVDVTKFSAYVEREIPLPDGTDPSKITTALVLDPDGTTHHVPTYVVIRDGKYYAVVKSLTNSTYSTGVSAWAQQALAITVKNDIIQGNDKGLSPTANITRAEAAAVVQRMLLKAGLIQQY